LIHSTTRSMRKPATRKSTPSAKARSFAVDAAALMAELKCSDVIVIDLEGRSEVCDFVVIGSGTSQRQMRSVGEAIDKMGKERGSPVWRSDADSGASWIVFDFVDVVVHLFEPGQRAFYDLEGIWSDAERVAWRAAPAAASATRGR
jgi:ribosome-associated protein